MNRAIKLAALALAFALATTPARAADEDDRFLGGSYDGYSSCVMPTPVKPSPVKVSLSSGTVQLFDFIEIPFLQPLTITAQNPQNSITVGNDMNISVPAAWQCKFDANSTAVISGDAAAKVGTPVYANGDRALSIPVVSDFTPGDSIVISGLRLLDLRFVPSGARQLELDFNGDGICDVHDSFSIWVCTRWRGGAYDGWASDVTPTEQGVGPIGTVLFIN